MAGQSNDRAGDAKRKAESAAKVVLAKHPCVVAGSVPPPAGGSDAPLVRAIDLGTRNIGRGLRR